MICIKCQSTEFIHGLCKECAYADTQAAKLARLAQPKKEWECCNDLESCKEDEPCEDCCEHEDVEDFTCLYCGADRTEDMMCRAYDSYKDSKYE